MFSPITNATMSEVRSRFTIKIIFVWKFSEKVHFIDLEKVSSNFDQNLSFKNITEEKVALMIKKIIFDKNFESY